MKIRTVGFLLLSIFVNSSAASALVMGGTNFGITGYPKHSCWAPTRPIDLSDEYEASRYKSEIDDYLDCIREYVRNAKNDADRITEQANEAIDEANSQRW